MKITHKRISDAPPPDDDALVSGDDWNADHALAGTRAVAVGFTAPGGFGIGRGGGIQLEEKTPDGYGGGPDGTDPIPGMFVLRLLPSSGCKLGTINQAMNAGFFAEFGPRDKTRDVYGSYSPPPPTEYPGLTIGGIRVAFMNTVEYAIDPDTQDRIYALSPEEDADPAPIIKGLYYRAYLIDEDGHPAWYYDEEADEYITPDPMPWFDFKITAWVGMWQDGHDANSEEDFPDDDLWLIPDGYTRFIEA